MTRTVGVLVVVAAACCVLLAGWFLGVSADDYADDHAGRCAHLSLNGPGTLVGTQGKDCLAGSNGPDIVRAKGGNDVVAGNHGPDVLKGSGGDDRLWLGRGPDYVNCGPGFDVVHNHWATGRDYIDPSCEEVRT
jgi:Ca2+-binding RTX toxin-like protein